MNEILRKILTTHPDHPCALHYLLHNDDDPAHARLGLAAARTYAKVAPDAEHAMHMTSHIFIALGMWDDVVAANEAASPDARKFGVGAPPDCSHYGTWLQYAYLQQGRLADARRMLEACRTGSAKSTGAAFGFELGLLPHGSQVRVLEGDTDVALTLQRVERGCALHLIRYDYDEAADRVSRPPQIERRAPHA